MFVRKSTYDALRNEYAKARAELIIAETRASVFKQALDKQVAQWNAMVERINAKGGETFLRDATIQSEKPGRFTQAEIMTLIKLCHPDKHARSEDDTKDATMITSKLLKMRRKKAT